MYSEYFTLHESIVDRDDLSIYEKMCCVVLARYIGKDEFKDILSKDIIAIKMGCSNEEAYNAIKGLINKGILEEKNEFAEYPEVPKKDMELSHRVIREGETEHIKNIQFTELNTAIIVKKEEVRKTETDLTKKIEEVRCFLEEIVSEKVIRILLNIAGGDVELIKRKYGIAKTSQLNDVMEVLMHELQKKEPTIIKMDTESLEKSSDVVNQINKKRIAELYKNRSKS